MVDQSTIDDVRSKYPDECAFLDDKEIRLVIRNWKLGNTSTADISTIDSTIDSTFDSRNQIPFENVLTDYLLINKDVRFRNRKERRDAKRKCEKRSHVKRNMR